MKNLITRLLMQKQIQLMQCLNALETLPFFEDRKFVIIRNTPYFKAQGNPLSDHENERLINYLSTPYESNCVLFITESNVDKT